MPQYWLELWTEYACLLNSVAISSGSIVLFYESALHLFQMPSVQLEVNLPGCKFLSLNVSSSNLSFESVKRVLEVVEEQLEPFIDPMGIAELRTFLKSFSNCSSSPSHSVTSLTPVGPDPWPSSSGGAPVASTTVKEVI